MQAGWEGTARQTNRVTIEPHSSDPTIPWSFQRSKIILTMDNYTGEYNSSGPDDSNFCPIAETESTQQMWIRALLYILIMAASLIGNSLVLCFVHRSRQSRTTSHLFVANMAVADLVMTFLTMPAILKEIFTSTDISFGGWPGDLVCKLLYFFQDLSIYCSILTLVAIAFDRFFAITMPLKRVISVERTKYIIGAIWFTAVMTSAPLLYANKVQDSDGVWFQCIEDCSPLLDPVTASRNYTKSMYCLHCSMLFLWSSWYNARGLTSQIARSIYLIL